MSECIVPDCVRDKVGDYCAKHRLAKENLDKAFSDWQVAYGKAFSRKDYLERISDDYEVGAGSWVIEVAEYLLTQE